MPDPNKTRILAEKIMVLPPDAAVEFIWDNGKALDRRASIADLQEICGTWLAGRKVTVNGVEFDLDHQ